MVTRYVRADNAGTACPSCGAAIKAPPSPKRRRVQCPKCREVVFIEAAPPSGHEPPFAPPSAIAPEATRDEPSRIGILEARLEVLEAVLRHAMAGGPFADSAPPRTKLLWISAAPGHVPDYSAEQERVLMHNLGGVRPKAITIRTPAGDSGALGHAGWFKAIFQRAGWTVHGPDEIVSDAACTALALAVPELPVAQNAAATYLALKAAGFDTIAVLDPALGDEAGAQSPSMALTLPPEKAA